MRHNDSHSCQPWILQSGPALVGRYGCNKYLFTVLFFLQKLQTLEVIKYYLNSHILAQNLNTSEKVFKCWYLRFFFKQKYVTYAIK